MNDRTHPTHPEPCTRAIDGDTEPLGYCTVCYRDMPQVGQERATRPADSLPGTDGPNG